MSADPIKSEQKVFDSPGSPNGTAVPAVAGNTVSLTANPLREYTASGLGANGWFINYPHTLPWPIDDVTQDFGDDLYERMALDTKIIETLTILKTGIIEEGMIFTTALGKDDAEKKIAEQIKNAAVRMFDNANGDSDNILYNMLDALHLGNKVAELIFDYDEYDGKPLLNIKKIHVKSRRSTAFVVDSFGNIIGLLALIPGVASPVLQGSYLDPQTTPNIMPREKFWVFTFRPRDEDVRGTSILRPAYEFWNIKHQIIREYLKYLTQFASASLFATTPEGASIVPELDENKVPTGRNLDPWVMLRTALETFRNGSVMAAPFGTELKPVISSGDGTAFVSALRWLTAEIVSSILGQTLASEESTHNSRGASATHQDILDTIIRQMKRSVCRSIRKDILVPWVIRNWGEEAVTLTPSVSLGEAPMANLPELMTSVSNLFNSGYPSPTQILGLDNVLNLSQRTAEEIEQLIKKYEEQQMNPQLGNGTNIPPVGAPARPTNGKPSDNQAAPPKKVVAK